MGNILLNAFGLFFIILFGYGMKKIGFFQKSDGQVLSKIIINVTVPATIIINLAPLVVQVNLLFLIFLAMIWTVLQLMISWFFTRKEDILEKEFIMYCGSGFNIGNFTLPFVQSFLPIGVPILSLFDIWNSVMLVGGNNVLVERFVGKTEKFDPLATVKKLAVSVPFMCYLIMFMLRLFSISLPTTLLTLLQPIASANVFLSMFMIGLYMELKVPKQEIKGVFKVLGLRYLGGLAAIAVIVLLPLASLVKVILCLLAVTPIPLFSVISAVDAGKEEEVVGFTSSLSFLISLPLMTAIILAFQV